MASGEATICRLCGELLYLNEGFCNEIEEDDAWYCNHEDWSIEGGSCWQKRVVVDFPECKEWLYYGFTCDGCEPDEWGECTCTSGF